ncbi:polysaccharide biosynthesis/export family protein [Acidisphaera sp. S103]|uniref:polysaccharide biosynthesis/export family protein n=1 Tax=Acidisphaera sp. S103 TaxID=1747223 RepID=UPI00131E4BA4|nr:polysaccharide biosynthesis/export family protein [Acidisphaera sp. S103]
MSLSRNLLGTAAIGLALAACSTVPGSGPRTSDIERASPNYTLVDLNADSDRIISDFVARQRVEPSIVLPPGRANGLIGAGDLLHIAIWEPNPNGTSLTTDKSGIETTTRVAVDGTIGVPYVGRLRAAGHTPAQIEQDVGARLASEVPDAQVSTLVTDDLTNDVIVQGDVAKPGRYPVVPNSSGLLDILAMAGGPHTPDHQALVRITRGGSSVTRTLSELENSRALEKDLAPGDRILVEPRQSYFYAFGEVNHPGEQIYDADKMTLAHTLARIEGLSDNHADPAAVFIYRHQAAELTSQLAPGHDSTQVIYRLNLRDPAGFFVSQRFPVLPDDLIYVSESPISEAAKVFQIITGVSAVGGIPRNLGANY